MREREREHWVAMGLVNVQVDGAGERKKKLTPQ
jgi:hypothetical protein